MSLPKDKLNEIIKEIQKLPDSDTEQVVIILEDFIRSKKQPKRTKPSDFFGIWADQDIDVEKVSRELRDEWERDIS